MPQVSKIGYDGYIFGYSIGNPYFSLERKQVSNKLFGGGFEYPKEYPTNSVWILGLSEGV